MVSSHDEKIACSVGVTAYNEEGNIAHLLEALLDQHLHDVEIAEIIVVASACTDRTVPIVREFMQRDRARQADRAGAARGQDQRRQPLPGRGANAIFACWRAAIRCRTSTRWNTWCACSPTRPWAWSARRRCAVDTPDHIIGLLSHLRLRMEHELCLEIPRLGEMIAFRKVFDRIPADVAMDEAFVEAFVVKYGMQVRYAPDAIVYNTGPTTIPDFIRQRRRNHAGHLYLKHKYGYAVSSIQNQRVLRVAFKEVVGVIKLLWVLFLLALIEGYSRLLGWYDFAIKRDRHVIWNMAWTQKQDVHNVRQEAQPGRQLQRQQENVLCRLGGIARRRGRGPGRDRQEPALRRRVSVSTGPRLSPRQLAL